MFYSDENCEMPEFGDNSLHAPDETEVDLFSCYRSLDTTPSYDDDDLPF